MFDKNLDTNMEYIISEEDGRLLDAILPYFEYEGHINVSNCLYKILRQEGENVHNYKIYDRAKIISEFLIKYEFADGSKLDPIINYKGKVLKDCGSLANFIEKNPTKEKKSLFSFKKKERKKPEPDEEPQPEVMVAEPEKKEKRKISFFKKKQVAEDTESPKPLPEGIDAPPAMPQNERIAFVPLKWKNEKERFKFKKHKKDPVEAIHPVAEPVEHNRTEQPAQVRTAPEKPGRVKAEPGTLEALNKKINLLYWLYCVSLLIASLSFYVLLLEHKKRIKENAIIEQQMEDRLQTEKSAILQKVDSLEKQIISVRDTALKAAAVKK